MPISIVLGRALSGASQAKLDDGGYLHQGADHAAMQGRQHRVADQLVVEMHGSGQFIPHAFHGDAEEFGVRNAVDQFFQGGIARQFGFKNGRGHLFDPACLFDPIMKAPTEVAMRSS